MNHTNQSCPEIGAKGEPGDHPAEGSCPFCAGLETVDPDGAAGLDRQSEATPTGSTSTHVAAWMTKAIREIQRGFGYRTCPHCGDRSDSSWWRTWTSEHGQGGWLSVRVRKWNAKCPSCGIVVWRLHE